MDDIKIIRGVSDIKQELHQHANTPIMLDALTEFGGIDLARPFYEQWWAVAAANGITEANFATWLRDADSYGEVFAFLQQGACERMWEFVEGHRLPKVLGLRYFRFGPLEWLWRLGTYGHYFPIAAT